MVEDTLLRAVSNCAGVYRAWAESLGKPVRLWDDLSCADLALPADLAPNNATLLRPVPPEAFPELIERVSTFFAGRPGGGYKLWSLWPTPDLASGPTGHTYTSPCMIRDPGGAPAPPPPELQIVEAEDDAPLREAEALLDEVFEAHAPPPERCSRPERSETSSASGWAASTDDR